MTLMQTAAQQKQAFFLDISKSLRGYVLFRVSNKKLEELPIISNFSSSMKI